MRAVILAAVALLVAGPAAPAAVRWAAPQRIGPRGRRSWSRPTGARVRWRPGTPGPAPPWPAARAAVPPGHGDRRRARARCRRGRKGATAALLRTAGGLAVAGTGAPDPVPGTTAPRRAGSRWTTPATWSWSGSSPAADHASRSGRRCAPARPGRRRSSSTSARAAPSSTTSSSAAVPRTCCTASAMTARRRSTSAAGHWRAPDGRRRRWPRPAPGSAPSPTSRRSRTDGWPRSTCSAAGCAPPSAARQFPRRARSGGRRAGRAFGAGAGRPRRPARGVGRGGRVRSARRPAQRQGLARAARRHAAGGRRAGARAARGRRRRAGRARPRARARLPPPLRLRRVVGRRRWRRPEPPVTWRSAAAACSPAWPAGDGMRARVASRRP